MGSVTVVVETAARTQARHLQGLGASQQQTLLAEHLKTCQCLKRGFRTLKKCLRKHMEGAGVQLRAECAFHPDDYKQQRTDR